MAPETPEVSVVIPVFNGKGTIARTVAEVREAFHGKASLEVLLVDDGSSDSSAAVCAGLAQDGAGRTVFLRLSRNFGEHNAVMAGLRHSTGAFAVIIDDDLQHDARDAVRLYEAARDDGKDLVYGALTTKEHSWWRNAGSRLNGWMATVLLGKPPGLYLSSFKCMSRWLIDELCRYKGPYPYIDGLALRCTANLTSIPVSHRPRAQSRSGYLVFSGVQLLILGLLGEYLGRLYMASSETPQYAVRERLGPP